MRLGFSYHVPALMRPDGSILTAGHQGRFLDGLASNCEALTCFLHTPNVTEIPLMDAVIRSRNIRLVSIGPHDSVPRRLARTGDIVTTVRSESSSLDAILLRGPSPLLPAVGAAMDVLPRALLLVGDNVDGLKNLSQPWPRRKAIEGYTHWNEWRQRRLSREVLTLVNSKGLYEKHKAFARRLQEVRTTTLEEGDFYRREDTCKRSGLRLLYTGRLEEQKGLFLILDALRLLKTAGFEMTFQFAGWSTQGDDFVSAIYKRAAALGVRDSIQYLGYRQVGSDLLQCYREADIYVMGSMSESFPRTIWEAMGSSLPVVATKVGSIPALLRDGEDAVLVAPQSASAIAEGIRAVVEDTRLRRRLIANGFLLAQDQTIEATVPAICDAIRAWAREWHSESSGFRECGA